MDRLLVGDNGRKVERRVHLEAVDIGSRFKRAADGSMVQVYIPFFFNENTERLMTNFLEAVQKHTMGETVATSEVFVNHEQVVALTETPPTPGVLLCNIGPFKKESGIMVSGSRGASAYCNLTLMCAYKYIENAAFFRPDNNFCFMHGGLNFPDTDIFERCVPNAMQRIKEGKPVIADDVNEYAQFNDVHRLGFGGSVVTGRLAVPEACTDNNSMALEAIHSLFRTTVVGHTPQWLGIPTIIREKGSSPKYKYQFLVALDTQFSDRQKNNHSLGLCDDGSFCLRGSWMGYDYTATSDDIHIGMKIQIKSNGFTSSTPYFRVLAKLDFKLPVYIAVNYAPDPYVPHAPSGITTVCLVKFQKAKKAYDAPPIFEAEVVLPDNEMVKITKKEFIMSGTITLSPAHLSEDEIDSSMTSSKMGHGFNAYKIFVCGDIEASVDFLRGFLIHSFKMATGYPEFPLENLETWREQWKGGEFGYMNFDLPNDDSLGFDVKTVSDTIKDIMLLSFNMKSQMGIQFASIGDVIGDPVGKGNITGTELIHEFMCIHWANTFCSHTILGNRDINKLRLLQEIPYILKSENLPYLEKISTFQKEFASKNTTNLLKLKRLLGHFCYPFTVSAASSKGRRIAKHFEFEEKPIEPMRNPNDPPPIWEDKP